jgi:hypothetical protein
MNIHSGPNGPHQYTKLTINPLWDDLEADY